MPAIAAESLRAVVVLMRSRTLDGRDAAAIGKAFASIVAIGMFRMSLVLWGLRSRTA